MIEEDLGKGLSDSLEPDPSFYCGTESIHTSVCNATAAAATATTTTARFLISS